MKAEEVGGARNREPESEEAARDNLPRLRNNPNPSLASRVGKPPPRPRAKMRPRGWRVNVGPIRPRSSGPGKDCRGL